MNYFLKFRRRVPILVGVLPTGLRSGDEISENVEAKHFLSRMPSTETGWHRLKMMFEIDEFGNISSDLNSIYQAGFLGFFLGGIYGGIIQSRTAYINFMENNQATAFKSHLDAKKKLQDQVTVNFAKGAFRWGWRTALFTTSYMGISTCISVYRGKNSIGEYLISGGLTGALYKVNLGLKGMIVGGILGGALGGFAGCISLLILKVSGISIEDVRYWQYRWKRDRDEAIRKSIQVQSEPDPLLLQVHDSKLSSAESNLNSMPNNSKTY